MNNHFPPSVEKIVADYMDRLALRLKSFPADDARELLSEIRSHIYESYLQHDSGDEIERILAVLKKLGEPAEVISSRMPQAMARLGQKKKTPFYILAGILIALFGLPLGLGALGILVGLLVGLFGLFAGYFITAVSLVMTGFLGILVGFVTVLFPDFLPLMKQWTGQDIIQMGPYIQSPIIKGIICLVISMVISGIGLIMLWSSRYCWRGFRFVVTTVNQKIASIFQRKAV